MEHRPIHTDAPPGDNALDALFNPPPRPGRWRRRLVLVAVAVLLAGGGYGGYRYLGETRKVVLTYKTQAVQRGRVESQVTATGTLSALVTVQVGSQVSGVIQALYADYNSEVKAGQVIARLDPQLFKTDVAKARASLADARASLMKAEAAAREARLQYERDRGLMEKKVVPEADVLTRKATLDSALAQVASAQAAIAQARAVLEQAEVKLAYTTIVSPINGLVVSRSVDVGQTVAASLQAPVLFTIAEDLRQMEVHTSVAESDVGQLEKDMKVRFTVDAYPGETFDGEVKQVRYEAQTVQNVVTYDAVVLVRNEALKLRPGMTANATFIVAARSNALVVPNAALRFKPQPVEGAAGPAGANAAPLPSGGAKPGAGAGRGAAGAMGKRPTRADAVQGGREVGVREVFIVGPDQKPRAVVVHTGITDGTVTEVVSGALREGDLVITGTETGGAPGGMPAPKNARPQGPPGSRLL